MGLRLRIILILTKIISGLSLFLGLGAGATWPGEIALQLDPNIFGKLLKHLRNGVIIVAGTNGKTTTSLMTKQILLHKGKRVIHNSSGANLLNGLVSSFVQHSNWFGKIEADWGVFEVDENILSGVISNFQFPISNKPIYIVLLNLFRDQLDRYGEVDVIADKWRKSFHELRSANVQLILNADDPLIAFLGKSLGQDKVTYFGVEDEKLFLKEKEHATDSVFCLNCGGRLIYKGIYFSHLGIWKCKSCGEKRPTPQVSHTKQILPGIYNLYNFLAAKAVAIALGFDEEKINQALTDFKPAFGRQEEFEIDGKKIKIFLSKNPTGFNASLRTVLDLNPKALLLLLNDRIPDGRDVSWIWDVDFEKIPNKVRIFASGDRAYDLALRISYSISGSGRRMVIFSTNTEKILHDSLNSLLKGEILFVLPTYSAMLEVRKILTGRKIL